MESNYVKSARIKFQKLGVTDYKSFKQHEQEIFEIIYETTWKEYSRKLQESLPDHIDLGDPAYFTVTSLIPEQKSWEMQTLEYYSRSPQRFINDYF